jgi:PAS domain S-box-containing protein
MPAGSGASCPLDQVLATGRQFHVPTLALTLPDGTKREVAFTSSPTLRHGEPDGCLVQCTDLAPYRLRDIDTRRLANLAEESPNPIAELDPALNLRYANQAMMSLLADMGYSESTLPTVFPASLPELIAKCLADDRPIEHVPVSVGDRHIGWSFYPLTQAKTVRAFGIDLTPVVARQRAEEALRQSEERLYLVANAANDLIWDWDLGTNGVWWNDTLETRFGYRTETVQPTLLWKLDRIHPDDRARVSAGYRQAFQSHQGSWSGEYRFAYHDGTYAYVLDRAFIKYDETGAPVRVVGSMLDLTEHKRVQTELQAAKEAAEAASRAKSEFVANMSHEIRTPMNGIIGMAELALDTELNAEQRDYLEMVKTSADSLLVLINDILDFAKIEARKLDIEPINFNLRTSLGTSVKMLRQRAHEKGIELAFHILPNVPDALIGDPGRIRQVVMNLLSNAIKFTHAGEVVLRVQCLPEEQKSTKDSVMLHCSVSDTGIGIPADKHRQIFEAFTQADGSTTRKYGGTGLGLSISSQLVALMGGRLWVDSVPGKGSTFHFTVEVGLQPKIEQDASQLEPQTLRDLRVLVVDDNATTRRILQEILASWHMQPTIVPDGPSALKTMEEARQAGHSFPLALLDGKMPQMDGFALASRIKARPEFSATKLILLTSAGQRGDAARCREIGMTGYLIKPVLQSDLMDALLTALAVPQSEGQPAPVLVTRHSVREQPPARSSVSLSILLAEDHPVNQALATRLLQKWGHQVKVVGNGREALAALAAESFDLLLTDIQMPEMDGLALAGAIRTQEQTTGRHLPIIVMTAHALKGDRERCLESGMDAYIAKPLQPAMLNKVIDEVMSSRTAGGSRPPTAPSDSPPGDAAKVANPTPLAPAFDYDSALERVEGDHELLMNMLGLYLDSSVRLTTLIQETLRSQDARGLERAAHTVKGAVGTLSAQKAFDAALRLEHCAKVGDFGQAREAWSALEQELQLLRASIESLVKQGTM